ncbi:MAG TPA: cysteine-rich CWC family protein [Burkholderiales bacterium]|nr:cysteine-rich CWC family protein [Burkholderiales bacterium]
MNPAAPAPRRCPDCGSAFECGMGADTPCWCSTQFMPALPVPAPGADCYCAACLHRRIEAARRAAAGDDRR